MHRRSADGLAFVALETAVADDDDEGGLNEWGLLTGQCVECETDENAAGGRWGGD